VQNIRAEGDEGQLRSRHAVAELSAKAELAKIDLATAEDELKSAHAQIQSSAAGRRFSRLSMRTARCCLNSS